MLFFHSSLIKFSSHLVYGFRVRLWHRQNKLRQFLFAINLFWTWYFINEWRLVIGGRLWRTMRAWIIIMNKLNVNIFLCSFISQYMRQTHEHMHPAEYHDKRQQCNKSKWSKFSYEWNCIGDEMQLKWCACAVLSFSLLLLFVSLKMCRIIKIIFT